MKYRVIKTIGFLRDGAAVSAHTGALVDLDDDQARPLLALGRIELAGVPAEAPNRRASRGDWAAFLRGNGIEVDPGAKRDELVELWDEYLSAAESGEVADQGADETR